MAEREVTERGFRIFAKSPERDGSVVWVQESSLACEGPHVRILTKGVECSDHPAGYHHKPEPHLSYEQTKLLIDALQALVDEADAGDLAEPSND